MNIILFCSEFVFQTCSLTGKNYRNVMYGVHRIRDRYNIFFNVWDYVLILEVSFSDLGFSTQVQNTHDLAYRNKIFSLSAKKGRTCCCHETILNTSHHVPCFISDISRNQSKHCPYLDSKWWCRSQLSFRAHVTCRCEGFLWSPAALAEEKQGYSTVLDHDE